jgi:hypothetical protein
MSELLLQILIVVAFGAFCFGCGYLTAFIVARNQWRDEMIKRGVARYNCSRANGNGESRQAGPTRMRRGGLRRTFAKLPNLLCHRDGARPRRIGAVKMGAACASKAGG